MPNQTTPRLTRSQLARDRRTHVLRGWRDGRGARELASELDVHVQTVYGHLYAAGLLSYRARRVADRRSEVARLRQLGWSIPSLARHFEVSWSTIGRDLAALRPCARSGSPADPWVRWGNRPAPDQEPDVPPLHFPAERARCPAPVHDQPSGEIASDAMWEARRALVLATYQPGQSISSLARELGLSRRAVRRCLGGRAEAA